MAFDPTAYATMIANTESARVDRDFIGEGDHVVAIESVIGMTSSNTGNDLVIIEASIISSTGDHRPHDKVKQIFQLSGVPSWKAQENMGKLKSIVEACLPTGTEVTPDLIGRAIEGGENSALAGAALRVIGRPKTSKKGASFLGFSYTSVPESVEQGWQGGAVSAEQAAATHVALDDDVALDPNDMPF
jgi:hypothetical protein